MLPRFRAGPPEAGKSSLTLEDVPSQPEPAPATTASPLRVPDPNPHACSADVRFRVLGQAPMFSRLDPEALTEVNGLCRAVNFEEGESIYLAGDPAERLYVVAIGVAKLSRISEDGKEVLTDVLTPGDFLGALPALGQERYAESGQALTPLCLLLFEARSIDRILRDHPDVAVATLEAVSGRLAAAREVIHRLSTGTVERRLVAVLALLAERVGERDQYGTLLQVPLTREDLAGMTGSTPETVSRTLTALRERGLIEAGRRWVRILDPDALDDLAAG